MSGEEKTNVHATVKSSFGSEREFNYIRNGTYKYTSHGKTVKYALLPTKVMNNSFTFDDTFAALELDVPALMFDLTSGQDVSTWNMKLPSFQKKLKGATHPDSPAPENPQLLHYEGVIEANCKRLLKGTSLACRQAQAIFCLVGKRRWIPDTIAEWTAQVCGTTPLIDIMDFSEIHPDVMDILEQGARQFHPNRTEEDEHDSIPYVEIRSEPFLNGEMKGVEHAGTIIRSIMHQNATHVILTDNSSLLNEKIDKLLPCGLLLMNGSSFAADQFSCALLESRPVFMFKYTGGCCDLAIEMLEKAESYLKRKKLDKKARPSHPFKTNSPEGYIHPGFKLPFNAEQKKASRKLNILIEHFPENYNSTSVLVIDMFNISEDKLQDQLTKTMSVAFEGVSDLGGQGSEVKRLTYAWRLRHNLVYNAGKQKMLSHILNIATIILTLLSVFQATIITYLQLNPPPAYDDPLVKSRITGIMYTINLVLPLGITFLRGIQAALNPMRKWAAMKQASVKVEREIYYYRTKVGPYNPRRKGGSENNKDKKGSKKKDNHDHEEAEVAELNPRKVFSESLDYIWRDLSASDISRGAMMAPPISSDALDDINEVINSNIAEQKRLTDNLRPIQKKVETDVGFFQKMFTGYDIVHENVEGEDDVQLVATTTTTTTTTDVTSATLGSTLTGANLFSLNQLKNGNDSDDDKSVGGDGAFNNNNEDNDDTRSQVSGLSSTSHAAHDHDEESPPAAENKSGTKSWLYLTDEGIGSLSSEEYVKLRLIPNIAKFTNLSPPLASNLNTVNVCIIGLSVFASILSTFELSMFVPACFSVSGSVLTWMLYKQTDTKLEHTNAAIHNLHKLLVWWDHLTMIEKRIPQNKEILVMTTEAAIESQIVGIMTSSTGEEEEGDVNDAV